MLRNAAKISDFWHMRIGALKHEVFAVAYLYLERTPDGARTTKETA